MTKLGYETSNDDDNGDVVNIEQNRNKDKLNYTSYILPT